MNTTRVRLVAPVAVRPVQIALPYRPPMREDRVALAALMLDAYRGTIGDDGETLDDADAEIRAFFAGGVGVPLLECSFIAVEQERPRAASLIALHNGQPLAAYVFTAVEWKNRGLARGLLQLSINALAEYGYSELVLWVVRGNTPAEHLYHHLGFRPQ